ncbi:unnamed protein product [uncultured bacterium]|nr:unnamed protein product [uncultured bacterium]
MADKLDIQNFKERRIIIGLVTSAAYLDRVKKLWQPEFIEAPELRRIGQWCFEHYTKFNTAPLRQIEDIFYERARKGEMDKAEAELIEIILTRISDEYETDLPLNIDYLYEQTVAYFQSRSLAVYWEKVGEKVEQGKWKEAETMIRSYQPLTLDTKLEVIVYDVSEWTEPPPHRQWLLGTVYCRGFTTGIIGPGGVGKTTLCIAHGLALATNRDLTGDVVHHGKARVLFLSFEDDIAELKRRVMAAMFAHDIKPEELKGRFFCSSIGRRHGKLMAMERGELSQGELVDTVHRLIKEHRITQLFFDPFIRVHDVDENTNKQMDAVCEVISEIAQERNVAIGIPVHDAKGTLEAGGSDRGRGASARRDAFRLNYTLTTMTQEEAEAFGFTEPTKRRGYFRMDSSKTNLCPPTNAKWYQLGSVELENTTSRYSIGDLIQIVNPWTPEEGGDLNTIATILAEIDAGMGEGRRYSSAGSARARAAWQVVANHIPDKDEKFYRGRIKHWVGKGLMYEKDYRALGTGKEESGLFVRLDRLKGLKRDDAEDLEETP